MLPQGNFQVLEAKDGAQGLSLIRQEKPNLIMLDFLLPKVSGWEVFQQIQATPELAKIPLVVMSGRKEEVTEKLSEPFEYFEFLPKPFDQKQLIAAIKSAMAKAKLPRNKPVTAKAAPQAAATAGTAAADGASAGDIQALNDRIAKMEAEIAGLKKQLAQVVTFIKQKVK
jgi:DNA-binding response OmpR family regulator